MSHPRGLSSPSSFTTTLSETGSSTFTESEPSLAKFKTLPHTPAVFADLHVSPTVPASLTPGSEHHDMTASTKFLEDNNAMASVTSQGAVFRRTDMPPGSQSPMHRTLTVDYGVIVAGEVELELESGQTRTLKAGDTIVQRATLHKWKNLSDTEWVRMVWVQLPIETIEIAGQVVKEEWHIPGSSN
jgi:quercetin dioxygenase-like cupin family protein